MYDPLLSTHQYIPVQRLTARCACAKLQLSLPECPVNEEVIIVNPLPFNFTVK